MPMYHITEYRDNYSKTSENWWQYYRNQLALNTAGAIIEVLAAGNNIPLFKFKTKIAGRTDNDGIKDAKTMRSLKYLSNFWRTPEFPLIFCKINLDLTCSENCFTIDDHVNNQVPTFEITDTKFYNPVVIYQLKTMQSYYSNSNQVLKKRWTGININQK